MLEPTFATVSGEDDKSSPDEDDSHDADDDHVIDHQLRRSTCLSRAAPSQHDNEDEHVSNDEYVIDNIVEMQGEENDRLFEVKWFGHSSDDSMWEPVRHILRSHIVRYCKRKRIPLPPNISEAQVG